MKISTLIEMDLLDIRELSRYIYPHDPNIFSLKYGKFTSLAGIRYMFDGKLGDIFIAMEEEEEIPLSKKKCLFCRNINSKASIELEKIKKLTTEFIEKIVLMHEDHN